MVLAVQDHGQPSRTGVEHTVPEDARRSRSQPVVGDAERSCLLEEAHLRQPLAREPDVESRRDTRPHPRLSLHAADETANHDGTVNDGIRVRHHDDARCCCGRAALDIFLVLAPRSTPVGVDVDEAREQVQAICVQLARPAKSPAYLRDTARCEAYVHDPVEARSRVEHVGLSYDQFRGGAVPQHHAATLWAAPVVRARTAERTQTPAATWSGISDDAPRTTSPDISTPLLTGPGCMTSAPLPRWRRDTP